MSLESLKTFLTKMVPDTDKFGVVDPYNTFTFQFFGGEYNGIPKNTDLHEYIKQVTLPNASINGEQINIPGIQFATHRLMPMGDSGSTLRVEFLNTTKPFLEEKIFKWMREYTIESTNFPKNYKSNIKIGFTHSSHSSNGESDKLDFKSDIDNYTYNYYGVRPVEMTTYKPSNEAMTEFYRNVTFAYDYFWIEGGKSSNQELIPDIPENIVDYDVDYTERAIGRTIA